VSVGRNVRLHLNVTHPSSTSTYEPAHVYATRSKVVDYTTIEMRTLASVCPRKNASKNKTNALLIIGMNNYVIAAQMLANAILELIT
jgi:hypothetical protein